MVQDTVNRSNEVKPVTPAPTTVMPVSRSIILSVVVGVIGLILGGSIGFAIGSMHGKSHLAMANNGMATRRSQMSGFGGRGGMMANRLMGVVAAVNGSSFTVIGDGGTYTITTDSNTKWSGKNSVAVNDSVMISYSGSGTTLTATTVRVASSLPSATQPNSAQE